MRTWVLWLSAVVALCFAAGSVFAEEGGTKPEKKEPTRERLPQAFGVVKSVDADAKTIVVTVKKERDAEGTDMTFQTNDETKVFIGKEAKTLTDIAAGYRVMISFKKGEGDENATAVLIRAIAPGTEKKTEKPKTEKGE